jgi:hypothetical protein
MRGEQAMKMLATILGAMLFAASATAGDIYGGFATDPDLSVWQRAGHGRSAEATGVQPGIGDMPSTYRGGGQDRSLFKSTPNRMPGAAARSDSVDVYGGFGGADLPRSF